MSQLKVKKKVPLALFLVTSKYMATSYGFSLSKIRTTFVVSFYVNGRSSTPNLAKNNFRRNKINLVLYRSYKQISRIPVRLMFESSQWKMAVEVMKGNWGAVFRFLKCVNRLIH